jgi:hypothetical protein
MTSDLIRNGGVEELFGGEHGKAILQQNANMIVIFFLFEFDKRVRIPIGLQVYLQRCKQRGYVFVSEAFIQAFSTDGEFRIVLSNF